MYCSTNGVNGIEQYVGTDGLAPNEACCKCGGGIQYELFSLLMHSGSALAGHYFAYIKDLARKKWFKFNDSDVSQHSNGSNSGINLPHRTDSVKFIFQLFS